MCAETVRPPLTCCVYQHGLSPDARLPQSYIWVRLWTADHAAPPEGIDPLPSWYAAAAPNIHSKD